MPVLAVTDFGGGIAVEGSAETRAVNEVLAADSYRISNRGQLVSAGELANYVNILGDDAAPLAFVNHVEVVGDPKQAIIIVVGQQANGALCLTGFKVGGTQLSVVNLGAYPVHGFNVSVVSFPFTTVRTTTQVRAILICIGARPSDKVNYPAKKLNVLLYDPTIPTYNWFTIDQYDALGTGADGQVSGGTHGVALYPRFIIAYNNFVWLFGYDHHETNSGDGPLRAMFSNVGNPLKYGYDPNPNDTTTDRAFTDSDAITLGGAGDQAYGGCVWRGKLWVGTNMGLHFIEGFGRESFQTNGVVPIHGSYGVVGPHAMVEGPDGLLYGVDKDVGLWQFNGSGAIAIGDKLRALDGTSPGYWDYIWTATTAFSPTAFPGKTNADLVWMWSDPQLKEVWVVIPAVNSVSTGVGNDTVIIRYNVITGGFTRQLYVGDILYYGSTIKQIEYVARERLIAYGGGTVPGRDSLLSYGFSATAVPTALPDATLGDYVPFGPDGTGIFKKYYLVLSWDSTGTPLPITFSLTPTIDGNALTTSHLTISKGIFFADATITLIAPTTLVSASNPFAAGDVGSEVVIVGAGPGGATLTTTITAFTDAGHVTIATAATTAVAGVNARVSPRSPSDGDTWVDTSGLDANLGNATAGSYTPANPSYILRRYKATWAEWVHVAGMGQQGTRVTVPIAHTPFRGTRAKYRVQCTAAAGPYQLEGFGIGDPVLVRSAA